MVSGIYKRGHSTQASSASATPSLLASTTAAGPLSLSWKFPLRGDSLPFSRSSKHHIIHSDTKNGIDQLANYLRNESELNSGKAVYNSNARANAAAPAMHQSLVSNNSQGLRTVLPVGKSLMSLSNRSWHSLAQLGGDRKVKHKYTTSISGSKEKSTGLLVFQSAEDDLSSGYFASPPLSRQNSGEHEYRDPLAAKTPGSNDSVLLSAQTPPSNLTDSPTFIDGFDSMDNMDESKRIEAGVLDANMIIDMYADDSAQSKANSIASLYDSAYESSCSIDKKEDCNNVSLYLANAKSIASKKSAEDIAQSPVTIGADSDTAAINAMLYSLPEIPSAENMHKDSKYSQDNSCISGSSSLCQSPQMLQARSRMSMQQELRQKLVRCLQDDYVNCIQSQEIKASRMIGEAEERFKVLLAEKEKIFEQRLAEQELNYKQEIERQRSETKTQLETLQTKVADLTTERDELNDMLEDFVLTSTKLLEHKEAESKSLSQELGRLTFENQKLQKKIDECKSHAQAMSKEHSEVQERVDLLVSENMRLESINSTLTSDVAVAEERNQKIKKHAEETLQRANLEIERLQQKTACLQQESSTLQNKYARADTRMKSLQIQLQSAKRQNDELLSLCERLETPP